jgi:hypothetical protein
LTADGGSHSLYSCADGIRKSGTPFSLIQLITQEKEKEKKVLFRIFYPLKIK